MKKAIAIVALLAVLATLAGCNSTTKVTEFNADGSIARVTETKESVIETLAAQNKDKTFIAFREAYVVGLQVTPASTTTDTLLSLECVYAHKNTGVVSLVKDQQNLDKIAEIISAMKKTDSVSATTSGVSSGAAATSSSSATTTSSSTTSK